MRKFFFLLLLTIVTSRILIPYPSKPNPYVLPAKELLIFGSEHVMDTSPVFLTEIKSHPVGTIPNSVEAKKGQLESLLESQYHIYYLLTHWQNATKAPTPSWDIVAEDYLLLSYWDIDYLDVELQQKNQLCIHQFLTNYSPLPFELSLLSLCGINLDYDYIWSVLLRGSLLLRFYDTPIISLPKADAIWSIYHRGCICWDISYLPSLRGDILLVRRDQKETLIVSDMDLSKGCTEWVIVGISTGNYRVKLSFEGILVPDIIGDEFEIAIPITKHSNPCPMAKPFIEL